MEALMREPIGYKSWREISPPSKPDYIVSESNISSISNSKKNSLENAPERDAFLIVISTLINENQCLKAENNLLKNKMLMQQLNPTGQAKQEFPCSSDELHRSLLGTCYSK